MYDLDDNLICYLDSINELFYKYHYQPREITRKFKNSLNNYINLVIDNKKFKLYKFS